MNLHGMIDGLLALAPQSVDGATVTGPEIDTTGMGEALLVVAYGTVATSGTMNVKVQDADDDGTGAAPDSGDWGDVTDAAFTEVTPANDVAVRLGSLKFEKGAVKKWIRVSATAAVAAGVVGAVLVEGELDSSARIASSKDFDV